MEIVEGRDEYWRVGDTIRLVNVRVRKYLCTHKKQLEENKEYEVFVPKKSEEGVEGEAKNAEWVVCEQEPYIVNDSLFSSQRPSSPKPTSRRSRRTQTNSRNSRKSGFDATPTKRR